MSEWTEQQQASRNACLANWPEAESMAYDPRCCRFPKSCSVEEPEFDPTTFTIERRPQPDAKRYRLVPTNDELAERAKGLDAHTVIRNWLERHPRNLDNPRWSDWAVSNFLADPEIAQHITFATSRPVSAQGGAAGVDGRGGQGQDGLGRLAGMEEGR